MIDQDELLFIENHLDFWDKLTPSEKDMVIDNTVVTCYKKGSNLHSTDSECLGVVMVKSGELRTYILSEDGREVTLYRIFPGETCIFSASCVLNSITFDVHIDAEMDTEVFLLNIGTFAKLCEQNLYVENRAYKKMVERFSDVMWAMEQILFLSFDKRLAIFLIDEMAKNNSSEINLTQDQIARYVGSAREVVSRMLKVFQSDGIIEQTRGSIHIIDRKKLRSLVN